MKSNKVHVLHVVGEPVGGLRLHIHTLIKKHDTVKFATSYAYSSISTDKQFQKDIGVLRKLIVTEIKLNVRKKPHISDIVNIFKLVSAVRRNKIDIVHGHGAKGGLYARVIGALVGTKAIYTPHGGVAHDMFGSIENIVYRCVESFLKRWTAFFLFESYYTKDEFSKKIGLIGANSRVVYNGIDLDYEVHQPTLKMPWRTLGTTHIGVFGMLREQKGQHIAIKAAKLIIEQGYRITLHLFGEGTNRYQLEQLVHDLGITETVLFYGDVFNALDYMSQIDVLLLPSLFESFGYVALEGALCDKPMIASEVGGLKEILPSDGVYFVEPGSADSIANAVKQYLIDVLNEKVKKVDREVMLEKFSLNKMVKNIEKTYEIVATDKNK